MIDVLLIGLWLGFLFNAAPGAVFAESLRRGMKGGFGSALGVQIGSLVGDAVWAVLGLAGVAAIVTVDAVRVPLTVAGAIVLAWLGYQGVRNAIRPAPDEAAHAPSSGGALRIGIILSLSNPMNVIYWAGAASAVAAVVGAEPGPLLPGVFFGGFMLSSVLWCFVCAGLIAILRRALSPMLVRALEGMCGLSLIGFAALVVAGP